MMVPQQDRLPQRASGWQPVAITVAATVPATCRTMRQIQRFNRSVAITVAATPAQVMVRIVGNEFQSLSRDYRCCNE